MTNSAYKLRARCLVNIEMQLQEINKVVWGRIAGRIRDLSKEMHPTDAAANTAVLDKAHRLETWISAAPTFDDEDVAAKQRALQQIRQIIRYAEMTK